MLYFSLVISEGRFYLNLFRLDFREAQYVKIADELKKSIFLYSRILCY